MDVHSVDNGPIFHCGVTY